MKKRHGTLRLEVTSSHAYAHPRVFFTHCLCEHRIGGAVGEKKILEEMLLNDNHCLERDRFNA